jgi:catechol 2,3-dioxygenase-like lactoylglutathione lyase family enzyme
MATIFTELVVDCHDPATLAAFWQAVLGYEVVATSDGEIEIGGGPGTGPTLLFQRVPEEKVVKNRLHLDVSPAPGSVQAEEVDRVLGLGATPVDIGQGDVSWVVLADPEGNEFCILRGQ